MACFSFGTDFPLRLRADGRPRALSRNRSHTLPTSRRPVPTAAFAACREEMSLYEEGCRIAMKRMTVSIRLTMLGIAGLAVLLAILGRSLYSRRELYLKSAQYHSRRLAEEQRTLGEIQRGRRLGSIRPEDASAGNLEKASTLRVSYHSMLKKRYQNAANRPWVSLSPDPPDPGDSFVWQAFMYDPGEVPWSASIKSVVP